MNKEVKTDIYLLRHGEKNFDGSSLSQRGVKQSRLAAKRFKGVKFNKIYCSPLERCKQTVEIIAKSHHQKVIYDDRLEEVDGDIKEFPEEHKKEINRVKSFWRDLIGAGGEFLVVSSGNLNRIIIAVAMGINPRDSRFVQIPTGVTHFEFMTNGKTRIEYVDDTSHLPEKLRKRQAY